MTLLDECILLLSQMKGVLIVISDTQNAQSPTKEKKTYTVEEIAEQLDMILSILVDTFISKISLPMQPVPEIGSISVA